MKTLLIALLLSASAQAQNLDVYEETFPEERRFYREPFLEAGMITADLLAAVFTFAGNDEISNEQWKKLLPNEYNAFKDVQKVYRSKSKALKQAEKNLKYGSPDFQTLKEKWLSANSEYADAKFTYKKSKKVFTEAKVKLVQNQGFNPELKEILSKIRVQKIVRGVAVVWFVSNFATRTYLVIDGREQNLIPPIIPMTKVGLVKANEMISKMLESE